MYKENKDLLADLNTEDFSTTPYISQKKVILIVIGFSIMATFQAIDKMKLVVKALGKTISYSVVVKTCCLYNYLGLPLIALCLSLIVSLLPFQGMPYRKKYFPFFILVLAQIHLIEFCALTF